MLPNLLEKDAVYWTLKAQGNWPGALAAQGPTQAALRAQGMQHPYTFRLQGAMQSFDQSEGKMKGSHQNDIMGPLLNRKEGRGGGREKRYVPVEPSTGKLKLFLY